MKLSAKIYSAIIFGFLFAPIVVLAVLYPELGNFAEQYNKKAFRNLDSETLDYLNTLWENVKIN